MFDLNFREITISDAQLLLSWRTTKRISQFMGSEIDNDINKQEQWIQNSYNKNNYYHWIIQSSDLPIGAICVKDIDLLSEQSSWGFYIGNEEYLGSGGFVPPYFYNWIFDTKKISFIKAYVFSELTKVIKIHQMHNYKLTPNEDEVITKNSKRILIKAMSLKSSDWYKLKYNKFRTDFPTLHWKHNPFID